MKVTDLWLASLVQSYVQFVTKYLNSLGVNSFSTSSPYSQNFLAERWGKDPYSEIPGNMDTFLIRLYAFHKNTLKGISEMFKDP